MSDISFFILLAVTLAITAIVMTREEWYTKNPFWNPLRFWMEFAFNPKEHHQDETLTRLYQKLVNAHLTALSGNFLSNCSAEQRFRKEVELEELFDIDRAGRDLKRIKIEVKRSKILFWRARKLAELFGYNVFEHVKDYLNDALYPDVDEGYPPLNMDQLIPTTKN